MKEIGLTQGQVALVDDEDYDYLMQWKWYAQGSKKSNYFYAVRNEAKDKILMHRVILDLNDKSKTADHKNHNTLDNQKQNLRIASVAQNSCNRISLHKSSKFLGVNKTKVRNTWRASITKNYTTKYLGSFKTEEQAALAYDMAAKAIHGEYANLNFKR